MVSKEKKRFTVTLPKAMHARLEEMGNQRQPVIKKGYLIEWAVTRLLADLDKGTLVLPGARRD